MNENQHRPILGIVGGMGPLASSEFLLSIYEYGLGGDEQESPRVIMYSDPTFPDRTAAFLGGRDWILLERLVAVLESLRGLGASQVVLCCVTIHHLLPRLPAPLRQSVISLLDVIFEGLARTDERHLLVCSSGTRKLRLFENHHQWAQLKDRIVLPAEADQDQIHNRLIYPIKRNPDPKEFIRMLQDYLDKYEVDSFIAGCSEIHLLAKRFMQSGSNRERYRCIDPLDIIARSLSEAPVRKAARG